MNPPDINIQDKMGQATDVMQNAKEAVSESFTSVASNLKQTTTDVFDS